MSSGLTPDLGDPDVLARLFAPAQGEPAIGLAVSGGPDSLALLLLAQRWAGSIAQPPKLFVYSLDHSLRPDSRDEVAMVLARAGELNIPARGLVWTGEKPATGISEAARQARYALIGQAMQADGATLLLTAHHRQDQAETVLMRLAHGSGLEGLRGMTQFSAVEGVRVFRPLLDVEPSALAALVEAAGMAPALDPSNDDVRYERVRWRKLLPALAAEGLDSAALTRFAARMGEADAALTQMAEAGFEELVRLDGFGAAAAAQAALMALSPAIGRRVLGRALNIVGGRQKPRALGQVERLYDQLVAHDLPRGATLMGAVIRLKGDMITLAREPGRALPEPQSLAAGSALVWDDRFHIASTEATGALTVSAADFMPRHRLEQLLGFRVTTPAEAIRTAPMVSDADGNLLALGGWSFDERVKVQLLID